MSTSNTNNHYGLVVGNVYAIKPTEVYLRHYKINFYTTDFVKIPFNQGMVYLGKSIENTDCFKFLWNNKIVLIWCGLAPKYYPRFGSVLLKLYSLS